MALVSSVPHLLDGRCDDALFVGVLSVEPKKATVTTPAPWDILFPGSSRSRRDSRRKPGQRLQREKDLKLEGGGDHMSLALNERPHSGTRAALRIKLDARSAPPSKRWNARHREDDRARASGFSGCARQALNVCNGAESSYRALLSSFTVISHPREEGRVAHTKRRYGIILPRHFDLEAKLALSNLWKYGSSSDASRLRQSVQSRCHHGLWPADHRTSRLRVADSLRGPQIHVRFPGCSIAPQLPWSSGLLVYRFSTPHFPTVIRHCLSMCVACSLPSPPPPWSVIRCQFWLAVSSSRPVLP